MTMIHPNRRPRGRRILGQVAHHQASLARNIAAGLLLYTSENAQDSCLARPVRANEANPVARLDTQIDARENIQRTEGLGQASCD